VPALGDAELREVAAKAAAGDRHALERVVASVRDDVYRLALRMLWHPQDAEDATQEALIRIMTRVGTYRGEAAFATWAYRVAANHFLNFRKSRVERETLTFRRFGEELVEGLTDPDAARPDADLLAYEVKLGCTLGMLLCLDRRLRLAYVLTDVFDLPGEEAAFICDITPAALRKRASRARNSLREFVSVHCGLVNTSVACRCDRRVNAALQNQRVIPDSLNFAHDIDPREAVFEMERLHDLASLMRSHPNYRAPSAVAETVRSLIASGRFQILRERDDRSST
jgi:RNA polymerase sigma factor (sigma-70 family)